ncbi:MAG: phosphohistidine phosphatase SixA [Deltaproteobacteria bacterium]|nr:phosphohistidine phosphatase SixA [Deltaproteobacteria bacterium]
MRVLLVRHGIAIDEEPGLGDEERYLTPEGRVKTRKVAELLAGRGVGIDRILTSPLVRATQTAEIVAREVGCEDVRVTLALVPGATLSSVDAALAAGKSSGTLALVGHEPSMSAIAAHLMGLGRFPRPFKKAGVCAIALGGPHAVGKFEFFVTPKGPTLERTLEER